MKRKHSSDPLRPHKTSVPVKKKRTTYLPRTTAVIAGAAAAVTAAADLFAASLLIDYALKRTGSGGERNVLQDADAAGTNPEPAARKKQERQASTAFLNTHPGIRIVLPSADGLTRCGFYYPNEESHLWVLAVHGYRADHTGMADFFHHYYEAGYQVLAPDLRACGESGGSYVGMGWPDRLDLLDWISWIVQEDPDASIVLHGVSMGAAAVMMVSGELLPDNVKVLIEDCGYTNARDIFASEMRLRFGLPAFPLLSTAGLISSCKAGYDFRDADAKKQVTRCEKPMLFIHGTSDDFIPYRMMQELYDAKPGTDKACLTAPGAGHAQSLYVLGDTYFETVFSFIARHL